MIQVLFQLQLMKKFSVPALIIRGPNHHDVRSLNEWLKRSVCLSVCLSLPLSLSLSIYIYI